ncbi:dTMP kinase [Spiroplasma endosymbiont of Tricholauxania praeusta]|uniref:dTMP kinase n=1 Tax=Spiroplasma endosymbiont of Tricholauxania praeusta TaxID=3066296 RepID=UPI0030D23A1E
MLFITFEGPEGAGKTTVLKMIKEQLKQDGFDVIITREPGGSEISEQIRQVILNKENTLMDPWTEVLLYIAARRQHLIEKILPNKNSNKIIISDRFSDSTLAYQGYARNLDIDKINLIQKFIFEDYQPDLTVLFDIKPETGLQRILLRKGEKLNRLDEETLEFHQKVYNGYKKIAISNPNRVHTINANLSEKKVFNSVYELIINLVEEKGFKEKKIKIRGSNEGK